MLQTSLLLMKTLNKTETPIFLSVVCSLFPKAIFLTFILHVRSTVTSGMIVNLVKVYECFDKTTYCFMTRNFNSENVLHFKLRLMFQFSVPSLQQQHLFPKTLPLKWILLSYRILK